MSTDIPATEAPQTTEVEVRVDWQGLQEIKKCRSHLFKDAYDQARQQKLHRKYRDVS